MTIASRITNAQMAITSGFTGRFGACITYKRQHGCRSFGSPLRWCQRSPGVHPQAAQSRRDRNEVSAASP